MIAANIEDVLERIDRAAERAGRNPDEITLVAVSKTREADEIDRAIAAGMIHLGENRVQEAETKRPLVTGDAVWHLIGHLQSNKAKKAAALFDRIDSVDSPKLASILDETAIELGKELDVLIQVNISGEGQKSGCDPAQLSEFADAVYGKQALNLRGLMTIGSFSTDEMVIRREFTAMRTLFEKFKTTDAYGDSFDTLSMGMSGDYEIAVEEGANMVRVGTAIFGQRNYL